MSPEVLRTKEKIPETIIIHTDKDNLIKILNEGSSINEIPIIFKNENHPRFQVTLQKAKDQSLNKTEALQFFTTIHAWRYYLGKKQNGRETEELSFVEYFFPMEKNLENFIKDAESYYRKLNCWSSPSVEKAVLKRLKNHKKAFVKLEIIGINEVN